VRARSVLLVAASAVLGVVCGVGVGVATQNSTSYADPLGVGFPMRNLPCNSDTLLVLGGGPTASAVSAAAGHADGADVRYLETASSCRTSWMPEGVKPPRYLVYVAYPGDSGRTDACAVRMTTAHHGDRVVWLKQGNTTLVHCLCWHVTATMPVLREGMELSTLDSMYISALQNLLHVIGLRQADTTNGQYDAATIGAVRRFQAGDHLVANGVVGAGTWSALVKRGCRDYPT
jgi:hypothetical protein